MALYCCGNLTKNAYLELALRLFLYNQAVNLFIIKKLNFFTKQICNLSNQAPKKRFKKYVFSFVYESANKIYSERNLLRKDKPFCQNSLQLYLYVNIKIPAHITLIFKRYFLLLSYFVAIIHICI